VNDGDDDGWSDEGYYERMRMDMMNMKLTPKRNTTIYTALNKSRSQTGTMDLTSTRAIS
jgi:hypothetical protein